VYSLFHFFIPDSVFYSPNVFRPPPPPKFTGVSRPPCPRLLASLLCEYPLPYPVFPHSSQIFTNPKLIHRTRDLHNPNPLHPPRPPTPCTTCSRRRRESNSRSTTSKGSVTFSTSKVAKATERRVHARGRLDHHIRERAHRAVHGRAQGPAQKGVHDMRVA
jgi:hypothetical protein